MAATDPADIRAGIVAALRSEFDSAQVTGYPLTNGRPPAFDVDLDDQGINYDMSMGRGTDEWWFKVTAVLATGVTDGAQRARDAYLVSSGTGSVKGALEADRTLGGVVESLHVTNMVPRTLGASDTDALYLGAEFTVRVFANGA